MHIASNSNIASSNRLFFYCVCEREKNESKKKNSNCFFTPKGLELNYIFIERNPE